MQRGFTLIELLVVIAIIGLLSSIVMVSLNEARIRGYDGRRVADLRSLQNALELYYADHRQYPQYTAYSGPESSGCGYNWCNLQTALAAYIPAIPKDPRNVTPYRYYYDANSGDNYQSYGLMAIQESNYDIAANDGGWTGYATNGQYYEIGPQPSYCQTKGQNWWRVGSNVCFSSN